MIQPYAARTHEKMKEVLMNPEASGPELHYYMIRGGSDKKILQFGKVELWVVNI